MIRLNSVSLYYDQFGEGADLVWIAGGDQRGSSWHEFQAPAFSDSFRQTTYDPRGIGETVVDVSPPWRIEDFADDCIGLIQELCEPPVNLVGLSMGSLIAQEVSLTRPDLVRCAVLMGTAARPTAYMREWERAEVDFRRQGGELTPEFAVAHYGLIMYPPEVLANDALWARVRPIIARDYGTREGEGLAAQWQACIDYDSLERLPSCQVPLHVIAFSHDVQAPASCGKVVAEAAPYGEYHLLEGLAHCSCFGHRPDLVNGTIRDILDRYQTTSRDD